MCTGLGVWLFVFRFAKCAVSAVDTKDFAAAKCIMLKKMTATGAGLVVHGCTS